MFIHSSCTLHLHDSPAIKKVVKHTCFNKSLRSVFDYVIKIARVIHQGLSRSLTKCQFKMTDFVLCREQIKGQIH